MSWWQPGPLKTFCRSDETSEVASLSCDLVATTSEKFDKVYFFKNQSRSTGDYISEYFFKYLFL